MSALKVTINVYDIVQTVNKAVDCLGAGIYHTGIQVGYIEFAYGGNTLMDASGIYRIMPKKHDMFVYKYSIGFGEVEGYQQVGETVDALSKKYRANKYDMLTQNCNHFSDEFL
jgi:hypothetical protein